MPSSSYAAADGMGSVPWDVEGGLHERNECITLLQSGDFRVSRGHSLESGPRHTM